MPSQMLKKSEIRELRKIFMYGFLLTINITFSPPGLFDTPYDSHGVFDASLITTPTTRELYSLPEELLLKVIQFYDALMTVFLLFIYSHLYQCKLLTNSNKSAIHTMVKVK